MERHLKSWFSYRDVRSASALWGDRPSGLGHFDVAVYYLIGKQLERKAQRQGKEAAYWALDLGTYFGHSAFCVAYGASTVSKDPALNVLSIDIFAQPEWLLKSTPEVIRFVQQYGSTEPDAIGHSLDQAFSKIGLTRNPVRLLKQDVLTIKMEDLLSFAPNGYKLIMVDCGKTPELMNSIGAILSDIRVCPTGTLFVFQDLFDWHAPWNVYALWRLLKVGAISLQCSGPRVAPFAEKVADRQVGIICDRIQPSRVEGEQWCTPFTSPENELAALDQFVALFRGWGYLDFALKLECIKVGAFLRAGQLYDAEALIDRLNKTWPTQVGDSPLRNAYRRYMHVRTGHKDLTLALDTPEHQSRESFLVSKLRGLSYRLGYLKPIHSKRILVP